MTNEEYLRGALLGGIHLTSLTSPARGLAINLATLRDPQAASLLPESETLQRAKVGSKTLEESFGDLVPRLVARKVSEAPGLHATTHLEALRSLSQVSGDAQWQSLRADIWSRLEAVYSFRQQRPVRLFLEKHPFLTPLILQANIKIRQYFELSSRMVLEVSVDPDNGKHQELWVQIQTDLTPEVAFAKLARFDEEWWLEASATSGNLLNINLEYL